MMDMVPVKALTDEEIAVLEGQEDRIMKMLAQIDRFMVTNGEELIEAEKVYCEAKMTLDIKKHVRQTLVERARNLKALLKQI